MKKNLASQDRIARVIMGLALIGMYAVDIVGLLGLAGGIALIASGVLGWCAIYSTLGISTCRTKPEN